VSFEECPLVSVGLSFYNDERTLGDAIRSVLNQRYLSWELILINDGSTDRSLQVAESFVDSRIRLIHDGVNLGLCERLNQLVNEARGTYFARLDADDLLHPERLAFQVAFMQEHPEVDFVDTDMVSMSRDGRIVGVRCSQNLDNLTRGQLLRGRTPAHATVLGRLTWFRKFPYDPAYERAEDLELWVRALPESRFVHLSEPLYFVREGAVNVQAYAKSQRTCRLIYRRYGPPVLGYPETLVLIALAWLKELTYHAFGLVSAQSLLTIRRSRLLAPDQFTSATMSLNQARA